MKTSTTEARRLQVEKLNVEIYPDRQSVGQAVARTAAETIRNLAANGAETGVIFATGVSQLEILKSLTSVPGLPWGQVVGFHLDEYIGLPADHPASFRHYLRTNLTDRVHLKNFFEIDGSDTDPERACTTYASHLRSYQPELCFLGIGENGHLAFNDPAEADFQDPKTVKIVELDDVSRNQQLEERWFQTLDEVPKRAITLTMPTIMRVPRLLVTAPGRRKAQIVRRALREPISHSCPATILRTHPSATLFLDEDSAAEITNR